MKTHYKFNGKFDNEITIISYDTMPKDSFYVRDTDCQLERRYTVGATGELATGALWVMIESVEQVKKAWESGAVWF